MFATLAAVLETRMYGVMHPYYQTRCTEELAERSFERMAERWADAIGAECERAKPHPDPYLEAMRRLGALTRCVPLSLFPGVTDEEAMAQAAEETHKALLAAKAIDVKALISEQTKRMHTT